MPKISALTAITTATDDDLMYLVDSPSGTPASRKITFANVKASLALGNSSSLNVGTTAGTVAAGDHNHTGVYEAANANIQSHISNTSNPHSVTATQVLPSQGGNSGKYLKTDGSSASWETVASVGSTNIAFVIGDRSTTITTGIKGDIQIPFACTITGVTLLADQSGSIVIDLWKDTYANYPATVADTIVASAKPTITTATKSTDSTLTGWTTSVTAGDIIRINVDSVTTLTQVTLFLTVTR